MMTDQDISENIANFRFNDVDIDFNYIYLKTRQKRKKNHKTDHEDHTLEAQ